MATPIGKGKRRTKRTYLGSGAGSMRSGTGTTAKAKSKKTNRPYSGTHVGRLDMAKPMGKRRRRTKQTYLGSGAGSLKSGTGATAKKAKKAKSEIRKRTEEIFREYRSIPKPKGRELRPLRPKSPATGLGSVFGSSFTEAKKQRKRIATTLRKKAKR
jgi:hypothetical protein